MKNNLGRKKNNYTGRGDYCCRLCDWSHGI